MCRTRRHPSSWSQGISPYKVIQPFPRLCLGPPLLFLPAQSHFLHVCTPIGLDALDPGGDVSSVAEKAALVMQDFGAQLHDILVEVSTYMAEQGSLEAFLCHTSTMFPGGCKC